MASLLGQFFTSIKGSQEDIASKGLAYILDCSKSAQNTFNGIIKNKTGLQFDEIKYITQSVGKEKERPDISGRNTDGVEKIIIETKFWSSLTAYQPNKYLERLEGQSILIFVCPELRKVSLLCEIEEKLTGKNYTKNNDILHIENEKFVFILDWNYILGAIKQSLLENSENNLVSDIDQIIGFCEVIDTKAFLPIKDEDLSPAIAVRINSYYGLVNKIVDNLIQKKLANTNNGRLKSTGQVYGYTRYFMLGRFCVILEVHFLLWKNLADTPFWVSIKEDWYKPQTIEFTNRLKQVSADTNIKIYETGFNDLLYFALKPKINEVEDIVVDDISDKIIKIIEAL